MEFPEDFQNCPLINECITNRKDVKRGYREFKCRGMKSCENEVNLFSAAYNLKKIHNKIKRNLQKRTEL